MALTVTRQQYFTAVADLGDMDVLYQAIPASAESPIWIEFYAGRYVTIGDALSNATKAAFSWTDAQMEALFAAAAAVPLPSSVTRQQFFTAVAVMGDMDTLYQAISASAESPVWIEFYSSEYVELGDALSNTTQAAFGWTDEQMETLFAIAGGNEQLFSSLLPDISPSVPGCPQPLIISHLRNAAIKVCERTLLWRHVDPGFDLVPDVYEYAYSKPVSADVQAVFAASVNGEPLEVLTLEQAQLNYPKWAQTDSAQPLSICQVMPNRFVVMPPPDDAETYTVRMTYALKPTRTATSINTAVLNELRSSIIHMALQELLVMPNVAWADRELATYHGRQGLFEATERRARANLGNMRGTMAVRFPRFS